MSVFRARGGFAEWLRRLSLPAVLLAIALAPAAASSAEDDDLFSDDFLDEDPIAEDEPEKKESALIHWGFMVPADLLLSRPIAITNTLVGFAFFVPSTAILSIAGATSASWEVFQGEDWYFDPGPIQTAWQICVQDPLDYAVNRPLGQLSSDF